ncbi:MAG: SGNH/GDSL hydrolase family protein [Deltaproteobacteria bacterium]|jgi:lysophospholipase L1-like esterase|nr:SGNH/GDSL hydrolase family protein [Deltaproteobacteria bacterium]
MGDSKTTAHDAAEAGADGEVRNETRLPRALRIILLATPFVLFLGILAGIEIVVRATLPPISTLSLFVISPLQQHGFTDSENVTIFEGDPVRFWRVRPNLDRVIWDYTVVSTNEQGLRHEGPIGPKREGSRRIVTLGDSVTFGYRIPVVFPKRPEEYDRDALPYPLAMERDLRAANPDRDIEVVNLAVPGYTSHQGLAWLRHEIGRLEPDLVIACFGWNDANLRAATDREMMKMGWHDIAIRRALSTSQAISHLVSWRRERQPPSAAPFAGPSLRVPVEDYVDNFLKIAELAEAHGASVAVIGPVYRDSIQNPDEGARMTRQRDALRDAMQKAGIAYLEIPELTEQNHPENLMLFGELVHPNKRGHRLMEVRLLEFLSHEKMLWDLSVPELDAV